MFVATYITLLYSNLEDYTGHKYNHRFYGRHLWHHLYCLLGSRMFCILFRKELSANGEMNLSYTYIHDITHAICPFLYMVLPKHLITLIETH